MSEHYLGWILRNMILPVYSEVKNEKFDIRYGKTPKGMLANVKTMEFQKGSKTVARKHFIIISEKLKGWDEDEVAAIIAHELGHLVNRDFSFRNSHDEELAASTQAISRGFLDGYKKIFSRFCKQPCWIITRTRNGFELRSEWRQLGGIGCRAGSGVFHTYCPFAEDLNLTSIAYLHPLLLPASGICGLCKEAINNRVATWKCVSCSVLFHEGCLKAFVRLNGKCPTCGKFAIFQKPDLSNNFV
ncbi:MAG: M48 family metalloprotease [Candidatus Jordarchaeum sp.]|uniref:M48 family metalloprotease n=1 Tax=Candidatus Jordarchaeum sp. TaxID=2823881 RepID=UPI00404A2221